MQSNNTPKIGKSKGEIKALKKAKKAYKKANGADYKPKLVGSSKV